MIHINLSVFIILGVLFVIGLIGFLCYFSIINEIYQSFIVLMIASLLFMVIFLLINKSVPMNINGDELVYVYSHKKETRLKKSKPKITNFLEEDLFSEEKIEDSIKVNYLGSNDGYYYLELNNKEKVRTNHVTFINNKNLESTIIIEKSKGKVKENKEKFLYPYEDKNFFITKKYENYFKNKEELNKFLDELNSIQSVKGIFISDNQKDKKFKINSIDEAKKISDEFSLINNGSDIGKYIEKK